MKHIDETENLNREMGETLNNRERHIETTTERFNPVQTGEHLENLKTLGWVPVNFHRARCREVSRLPFAKHTITLRQPQDLAFSEQTHKRGGYVPEIRLKNANDGTSSFEFFAGFRVIQCLNGLVMGDIAQAVRIRHSLSVEKMPGAIAQAVEMVSLNLTKGRESIEAWQGITLTQQQRENFAGNAIIARFPGLFQAETEENSFSLNAFGVDEMKNEFRRRTQAILQPQRREDVGDSLWKTFNVIQENVIKGGWQAHSPRTNKQGETTLSLRKIRGLSNPTQNISLNRRVWDMAETLATGNELEVPALLLS